MKGFLIRAGIFIIVLAALPVGLYFLFAAGIRAYPLAVAEDNALLKQSGGYYLDNLPEDHVLVLGSSEINVKMIASHPANLMAGGRGGPVFNLAGRGSCQAIVHASILAAMKNPGGKKVAVILSPQSYVPRGIMPDMYFANFSPLQFCRILLSPALPRDVKDRFRGRMAALSDEYEAAGERFYPYEIISKSRLARALSIPYLWLNEKILTLKDAYDSYSEYKKAPAAEKNNTPVDWQAERARMLALGEAESGGNDFRFLNDYYNVNVKRKLETFRDRDAKLSYEASVEYGDLELLLDVCKARGIAPLVVSVPLHGAWSDYTGFTQRAREQYYQKVNGLVSRYGAQLCDFTGKEYEPYFLCDVMHLGWIGWLETNERIAAFYHDGDQ